MTALSVNLNKIALLRNSRGRDYPNLVDFAGRFIALGVDGLTVHPRPDQRHAKGQDVHELAALLRDRSNVQLNVEGYPSESFLRLIEETRPSQCTLVPDAEEQLTSDHGWDLQKHGDFAAEVVKRLGDWGVRVSLFLDPDPEQVEPAARTGAKRIELFTESYAKAHNGPNQEAVLAQYAQVARLARENGLGVNAGHDLDLGNLGDFLTIPGILEVSIGHALTVECIEWGMEQVVKNYLEICRGGLT